MERWESILWKKDKLKGIAEDSKKLKQPPKELPDIVPRLNAPKALQPLTIKTEVPKADPPIIMPIELKHSHTRQPEHDVRQFEDAINNINIEVIHTEKETEHKTSIETEDYYQPKGVGEGYFSEIEHYLKNKDVNEVMDDILKKDFLTSMKDYHDHKSHGKAFYLHKEDLKRKLERKMGELRELEEKWHDLRKNLEETDSTRKQLERQIDEHSHALKTLFKQVKASQLLEKEAPKDQYFRLRSGQELKTLNDLRKAIGYMSPEDFGFHVTATRNDFASWISHSLSLKEIGEQMAGVKTRDEAEQLLSSL